MRGINVGGKGKLPMPGLRGLFEELGCEAVQTYIQSGNVVFRASKPDWLRFAHQVEERIAEEFGVTTRVILRSVEELRGVAARCPFVGRCPFVDRAGFEPAKLQVTFLEKELEPSARLQVLALCEGIEEVAILGREMYGYFANGVGRSKLPFAKVERALGVASTARNWNSVQRLLAMGEES